MRSPSEISVFAYTDFRVFLAEYFKEQKFKVSYFSYRYFSNKAGFKSRDFLYKVIRGQKNLSASSVFGICQAIGFNQREAAFFEELVGFNQSKLLKERDAHFAKIQTILEKIPQQSAEQATLSPDQYLFFSAWYHTAIRSYIDLHPFYGDYEALAKTLRPAISPRQAKQSIELLVRLGLIKQTKDGTFRLVDKAIKTGENVRLHAMDKLYCSFMELAGNALEEVPRSHRNISGLTLGISSETYTEITKRIQAFRAELAELANRDQKADQVYQLTIHLFPLTKSSDHE